MKALVTGGHGFIGSHIAQRLLANDIEVVVLASPWGKLHNLESFEDHPGLTVERADITNVATLHEPMRGIDVVYHAAARALDWGPWDKFEKTNVEGTAHVLAAATQAEVSRFVQVSSVAVHQYTGFRDADPRETATGGDLVNYSRSKLMAEELVSEAQLETVIVRPGLWPFGARDPNFEKILAGLRSPAFPLVGGGRSVINTAYAENLAEGLVLAGTVPAAAGKTYVIADDGAPTWRELFDVIAELIGARKPWLPMPVWISKLISNLVESMWGLFPGAEPPLTRYRGQVMENDVHFHIDQARAELGYAPAVSWEEGLRRTVAAQADSQ